MVINIQSRTPISSLMDVGTAENVGERVTENVGQQGSKFPLCEMCRHQFHGLPCQHINSRYTIGGVMKESDKCTCQGPFSIDTLDEGPRTSSKKGKW